DGMGIPIGKLSLYTACAGLHPSTTLPVLLDVGTDNKERLADPVYIGWRHERVRGRDYDDFVDTFVNAVLERWPHVLLQWEDFARGNAGRMLQRYRDRLCTFNDDIQGTAAAAAGTLLAAVKVTGQSIGDQRSAIVGAGSAGPGIVDFQRPFLKSPADVADWHHERPGSIGLADVVANPKPTVLIGVSGQPGIFGEDIIRQMAAAVARPIVFPPSTRPPVPRRRR